MKPTLTQQRLLDKARSMDGYAVEFGGGRGAQGGRIQYGDRDRKALLGLEAAGVVQITHRDTSAVWTGNGNTVWVTVWSYRLTEPPEAA